MLRVDSQKKFKLRKVPILFGGSDIIEENSDKVYNLGQRKTAAFEIVTSYP